MILSSPERLTRPLKSSPTATQKQKSAVDATPQEAVLNNTDRDSNPNTSGLRAPLSSAAILPLPQKSQLPGNEGIKLPLAAMSLQVNVMDAKPYPPREIRPLPSRTLTCCTRSSLRPAPPGAHNARLPAAPGLSNHHPNEPSSSTRKSRGLN